MVNTMYKRSQQITNYKIFLTWPKNVCAYHTAQQKHIIHFEQLV